MIDPITVEVIGSALSSIVEEMGEALIRASYSTNIKERRDCSTALFDLHGKTLCQAEHIPMHLGSFLDLIPHIMKRHPAAVNGRLSLCQRVVDLIFGALAPAVPQKVTAASNGACFSITFAGHQPTDNALWVYLETIGGGSGARFNKDGLDGVHVHMTNTSNLPVEALELEYPLTLMRYELVDDSGGAGQYRGGMAIRRVYRADHACHVRVDGARILSAPWGLDGGQPGGKASITASIPLRQGSGMLQRGDLIEVITGGSGGFGPPAARDRDVVARDLAEGRISPATMERFYQPIQN